VSEGNDEGRLAVWTGPGKWLTREGGQGKGEGRCASAWGEDRGEIEARKMRKPAACASLIWRRLLLRGRRLGGLGPGEDGAVGAGPREEDGEADGAEHEDDGGVGGQLGEKVGCAARAEGRLGALTAEGSGEVGRFALLKEDDADDEERNDDVKSD
jgi:hypothetical protein